MSAVFVDPFAQIQAATDAATQLAMARSAATETLERSEDISNDLDGLTRLLDAAVVTVKGMGA